MGAEIALEILRERRRSLIWWSVGIAAMVVVNLIFYPSIRDSSELSNYSKDLPEAMRALFVGGETDLTSPVGFLNSQIFALLAPLLFAVFAIGWGGAAMAGDEERGTLDYLLALPVSRGAVVVQRFGAMAATVWALSVVLLAAVLLGSLLVDLEVELVGVLAATISTGLLALLFGTVGLSTGCLAPGRGRAIAVAAGFATVSWMLDGLAQAVSSLEPLRPISPYYQAFGQSPLADGPAFTGWASLVAATAVLVGVGVVGLRRRDVLQ